jgi:hypothetical protein
MTTAQNDYSACLTFDFVSFSAWLREFGFTSSTHMSKGEFAGRVALPLAGLEFEPEQPLTAAGIRLHLRQQPDGD